MKLLNHDRVTYSPSCWTYWFHILETFSGQDEFSTDFHFLTRERKSYDGNRTLLGSIQVSGDIQYPPTPPLDLTLTLTNPNPRATPGEGRHIPRNLGLIPLLLPEDWLQCTTVQYDYDILISVKYFTTTLVFNPCTPYSYCTCTYGHECLLLPCHWRFWRHAVLHPLWASECASLCLSKCDWLEAGFHAGECTPAKNNQTNQGQKLQQGSR